MIKVIPDKNKPTTKLALCFGLSTVYVTMDEARELMTGLCGFLTPPKSARRLQIALAALRVIANLPGKGVHAKVARIALADCRKIKEEHR